MTVPQLPLAYFGIFAPLAVQIMRQLVDGELMITTSQNRLKRTTRQASWTKPKKF